MFMFDTPHDQFLCLSGLVIDTWSGVLISFENAL